MDDPRNPAVPLPKYVVTDSNTVPVIKDPRERSHGTQYLPPSDPRQPPPYMPDPRHFHPGHQYPPPMSDPRHPAYPPGMIPDPRWQVYPARPGPLPSMYTHGHYPERPVDEYSARNPKLEGTRISEAHLQGKNPGNGTIH